MIKSDQKHVAMTKMSGLVATLTCQSNSVSQKKTAREISYIPCLYILTNSESIIVYFDDIQRFPPSFDIETICVKVSAFFSLFYKQNVAPADWCCH